MAVTNEVDNDNEVDKTGSEGLCVYKYWLQKQAMGNCWNKTKLKKMREIFA